MTHQKKKKTLKMEIESKCLETFWLPKFAAVKQQTWFTVAVL
jgi:hypothetical protein